MQPLAFCTQCSGDYRLEECPIPEVGEEEVLVRVLAVGVCSSDAKCFAGAAYYWGEWVRHLHAGGYFVAHCVVWFCRDPLPIACILLPWKLF